MPTPDNQAANELTYGQLHIYANAGLHLVQSNQYESYFLAILKQIVECPCHKKGCCSGCYTYHGDFQGSF
jgi:hypothetical protein